MAKHTETIVLYFGAVLFLVYFTTALQFPWVSTHISVDLRMVEQLSIFNTAESIHQWNINGLVTDTRHYVNRLLTVDALNVPFVLEELVLIKSVPLQADSNPDATESTVSVFDLRRPDFPAERVQEFLNQTVAGRDYPDFHTIPDTNFTCRQVEQPGFYADPEVKN